MAGFTLLQQVQRELIPYILKKELVDEKKIEKLGHGAYGTITKIKYCGTPCAAKELHPILLPENLSKVLFRKGNPESHIVERFCAEIKILSELRHPNFVRFIGVHIRENSTFPFVLVMELMYTSLGHCLTQYESEKEKFPLAMKLLILQDVATALVYLHSQDPPILHRDLSANNVLLTSNMRAKVADLGVAKILKVDVAKLTKCPGSVVYMPPEALKDNPSYGIEIDIYSYGVLGFHTFSGKWPNHSGSGSDLERCFVDLIGEGICLKGTLEKCINRDPKKRLKASEILIDIENVIKELKIEEHNFIETCYVAERNTKLVKEKSEHVSDLSSNLKSKEEYIQQLESSEKNNNVVMQQLRCGSEEKISAIKLLEEKETALNQEIKLLRTTIEHQESTIEELSSDKSAQDHINSLQRLIDVERESGQPCQHCLTLEKEKKDLLDLVTTVQSKAANLSSQVKTKDEQLLLKQKEVESKEKEIEQLNEKFKLIDAEIESTKSLSSRYMERSLSNESDSASLINSMKIEQSEKNVELLETIKDLKKQLSECDGKHKAMQDQYRKMLQDLLIPHKGILCSSPPCTVLTCKLVGDVSLKTSDRISGIVQNIMKAPKSSFTKMKPAVYYDSKVLFLCEMNCKKQKDPCVGATVWYDPTVGTFDAITNAEIACFGHFGTSLLGLGKNKQFFLLKDYAWEVASIPTLPADDLNNPVILTYYSLVIIVNGDMVWAHDDKACEWLEFEMLVEEGDFEVSPNNSFAILAGKLFVCTSSQETVYSVDLQEVIDRLYNSKVSENVSLMQQPKRILQLKRILKGATFIFRHAEDLLAFHNTPSTIDRVWYYDVRCYHWHNIECSSSDASGVMLKNWLSLPNCAGILELALTSAWTLTTSWGQAKLYEIQVDKLVD